MENSDDFSDISDEPGGVVHSLFRKLVGDSPSDEAVSSISQKYSSMAKSDEGLDLYSKLPPVGDPNRKEQLLDMLKLARKGVGKLVDLQKMAVT